MLLTNAKSNVDFDFTTKTTLIYRDSASSTTMAGPSKCMSYPATRMKYV